jgi:hypothetical protein
VFVEDSDPSHQQKEKTMATPGPAFSPLQQVTIYVDSKGDLLRVDPDTFYISKSGHEGVLWQSAPPNAAFTVFFVDSPFYNTDFDQNDPYSGEVRRKVPGSRQNYKYSVKAGTKTIDPGGVVNP